MIRLCKVEDDIVENRCQNYDAAFMPMRRELSYPTSPADATVGVAAFVDVG